VLGKLVSPASSSADYGRRFANSITDSLCQRPAQLHAMLFANMVHDRIKRGIGRPTTTELTVGNTAVRLLSQAISDPNPARSLSDFNIWAVLILGYSGRQDTLRSAPEFPRQSLLRELQAIHIYLTMDLVNEHVVGLVRMIELLGDLRKVSTPGIAQTISL
jgi:hypothetical protein